MISNNEFIVEAREHLKSIENSLLSVERSSDVAASGEAFRDCLRAAHSLKGDAGLLGYTAIRKLAHATESLLEAIRDGKVSQHVAIDTILLCRDRLAVMIEDLEHSDEVDNAEMIARIESLCGPVPRQARVEWQIPDEMRDHDNWIDRLIKLSDQEWMRSIRIEGIDRLDQPLHAASVSVSAESVSTRDLSEMFRHFGDRWIEELNRARFDSANELRQLVFFQEPGDLGLPIEPILLTGHQPAVESVEPKPLELPAGEAFVQPMPISPQPKTAPIAEPVPKALVVSPKPNTSDVKTTAASLPAGIASLPTVADSPPPAIDSPDKLKSMDLEKIHSLRVPVELIDRLMNLVGELTLVRNQGKLAFGNLQGEPAAVLQRLDSVTSELQETVIRTRMQPVGNLFGKFPRMVRDLGRQLGKKVDIVSIGNEVELDKTVIEQLSDPMMHLIRNSVDHGIEAPDVRQSEGKPIEGKITLTATPADGQVLITISDDGKGIDCRAIQRKAIETGLRTEAELSRMTEQEIFALILMPGFSTAKEVTDVSGRGVGMDVVKTNIERIDGSLTIDSTVGQGTVMTVRVPLTLAIIPCLIVTQGDRRMVVPQRSLEEIVCIHPGAKQSIEQTIDGEFYRLRQRLLPIVRLKEVLDRPNRFTAETQREIVTKYPVAQRDAKAIEYILVLRTKGRRFGLLVDRVVGQEEVVIKPMHFSMKRIEIFAGATLMGDGRVALILNVDGLAEHAGCRGIEIQKSASESRRPEEVHRIILFESGPKEQFAIPLVQIRRIESIRRQSIEYIGDAEFIKVDGKATEVIRLDHHLAVSQATEHDEMFLLLPKYETRPFGILATKIIDVDSLAIELQMTREQMPGILGTAAVRERMTLFVDLHHVDVRSRRGTFVEAGTETSGAQVIDRARDGTTGELVPRKAVPAKTAPKRILLVDDTPFFREIVRRYLEVRDHSIEVAVDGLDGLRKLQAEPFDLVVSDIEMPQMDGWSFCIEARRRGFDVPFIALTSLGRQEHLQQAVQCGFNAFEEKLDHDRLVKTVERVLSEAVEARR